jgi:hypothetical protein
VTLVGARAPPQISFVRRVVSMMLFLTLAAGAGCKLDRYDHHYPEPQPRQYLPCEAPRAVQKTTAPGYPGVIFGFTWYGGSSSWTHDGDPPAGDRCPPVPPGVMPRVDAPSGEAITQR